jgi:hypothetical protein
MGAHRTRRAVDDEDCALRLPHFQAFFWFWAYTASSSIHARLTAGKNIRPLEKAKG